MRKFFIPPVAGMVLTGSALAADPVSHRATLLLPESRISADDYPPSALALRQEGVVVAAFRIGPDGRVTSCKVAQSSGAEVLDQKTCEIVEQRFHFDPARNGQGQAVEEWRTQKISWKLPAAVQQRDAAARHGELLVEIAKDGRVESCEVVKSSGDRLWDVKMCTAVALNKTFEPAKDRFGRRQKSRQVIPVWE